MAAAAIPILASVAGAVVSGMLSPKAKDAPAAQAAPPPPAADPNAPKAAEGAADQERKRATAAVGRSDTILTQGLGALPDENKQTKTILGY